MKDDLGERTEVAAKQPEVMRELYASFDKWWNSVQKGLVSEDALRPE